MTLNWHYFLCLTFYFQKNKQKKDEWAKQERTEETVVYLVLFFA